MVVGGGCGKAKQIQITGRDARATLALRAARVPTTATPVTIRAGGTSAKGVWLVAFAIPQPPQGCFDCLLQFRGVAELGEACIEKDGRDAKDEGMRKAFVSRMFCLPERAACTI